MPFIKAKEGPPNIGSTIYTVQYFDEDGNKEETSFLLVGPNVLVDSFVAYAFAELFFQPTGNLFRAPL